MLFSIIIPVYNVAEFLQECLNSVITQTFQDWEAVCVNDGSTDDSCVILKEFAAKDPRFTIISKNNGGLSSARNTGLDAAKGDYILFLDSDDWLEDNALELLAEKLCDEDMLCFSGRRYFEEEGRFNFPDRLNERRYLSGMDYYSDNALERRDFAFVCVVLRLYKRSFLLENGLRFKEGIYHEDNLFTPQACFYAKGVNVIDTCLYNYRIRANSIMTTFNLKRYIDLLSTANELATFFISKEGFDKTVVYRSITHHYQVVFSEVVPQEKKKIRRLCDWRLYRKVSRTKLRHRMNYLGSLLGI
jgi:glycosyltransferase involved in cell wall biosynthesis